MCGECCKEEGQAALAREEYANDIKMASGEYKMVNGKCVSRYVDPEYPEDLTNYFEALYS